MKQSAVEWLIEEIKEARRMCDDSSMEMDIWHTLDVLIEKGEQAKEMEKQQIIESYRQGFRNAYIMNPLSKEQYYNETFKNK